MFWKRKTPPPDVSANNGVAAGRDIRDSTINLGLDQEGVRQVVQEELARVAREKGVSPAALQAVLLKLGEAGVPDYEIPGRLDAAANELLDLRAQLARLRNDRPEFAAIRQEAAALIDQGELDTARAALGRGRDTARAMREDMSRDEAEFLADEARIDHLQLAYPAAAAKYGEAFSLVAPFDPAAARNYLMRQASELVTQGQEFGDNISLLAAIDLHRRALVLTPREHVPLDWARIQNSLGTALSTLGGRETGTARLDEAVAAYREALKEWTRERAPLAWAATQTNLATALSMLGKHEAGTARLDEAVVAYREALKEQTRERVPLDWAMTQNNLGNALSRLGEREAGTARLDEAVAAYREALKEQTRERVPLDWATTQNNLGIALLTLGERETGTARLDEAVAAYDAALSVFVPAQADYYAGNCRANRDQALALITERKDNFAFRFFACFSRRLRRYLDKRLNSH